MTITNIITPLMMYADRLLIGTMISVTAVAYYATPGEVVTKLLLISGSLMGVLFPAFSSTFENDRQKTVSLFFKGIKYIYLTMFPIVLVILTLAGEGLTFWLGTEFSRQSTLIMQLMGIAIFFISLGQVPYSLIQGVGRPDITAKLHLIEFPFYLVFLWGSIQYFGARGAAFAWMIRAMIDSTLLTILARRLLGESAKGISPSQILFLVISFGVLVSAIFFKAHISVKLFSLIIVFTIHGAAAWTIFLNQDEKNMAKKILYQTGSHRI
jgi:O-antigen/teichoic acid export membrane protein